MPYADPEKTKAYRKAYYEANKEKIAKRKTCCEVYKEKARARANAWHKVNREKAIARSKNYRKINSEKISKQQKAYRKANPELFVAIEKTKRKNNPEKYLIKDIKNNLSTFMQIPANLIPPELIEAKVMQLKVMRLLRDAKKKTPPIKAGSR